MVYLRGGNKHLSTILNVASATLKPATVPKGVSVDDDFLYGEDLSKKISEKEVDKALENLKHEQLDPANWMQLEAAKKDAATTGIGSGTNAIELRLPLLTV